MIHHGFLEVVCDDCGETFQTHDYSALKCCQCAQKPAPPAPPPKTKPNDNFFHSILGRT